MAPSPVPDSVPIDDAVSVTPATASVTVTDDPPTKTTIQVSEDPTTERQEVTTEASEDETTTSTSSDQDQASSTTPASDVVPEQEIVDASGESETPALKEVLQNSLEVQLAGDLNEAGEPLTDSSSNDSSPGADVEYTPRTTTARTPSTRRSALLRFSSRSRKPVFEGTVPSAVQNERAISDLAAKLASKSNTESPLSALRNRLRASLAASIGFGGATELKTQAGGAPSNGDSEEPTSDLSSAAEPAPETSSVAVPAPDTSSVAPTSIESQKEFSTTELPEDLTTVFQELAESSSPQTSVSSDDITTEPDSSYAGVEATTISGLTETDSSTTTETEIPEITPNASSQEETTKAPTTTAAATTSTLTSTATTTARPRKLSLVQQLRQRQEQKKVQCEKSGGAASIQLVRRSEIN